MKTRCSKTLKSFLLAAMSIVAALLIAGCGGGGGGGLGIGNRGGDGEPPVLDMTTPTDSSRVADVDFRAESFYIQFSYNDKSIKDTSTLNVTLKMDNGTAQNITPYISETGPNSLTSVNLYQFNRSLFELATNQSSRVMTITFSIKDIAGNASSITKSFTVYPQGVPSPPQ